MTDNSRINYLEGLNYSDLNFPNNAYYQAADKLYKKKKNETFDNGLPHHALWGIYKLFEMANKSVSIFSGNLRGKENGSNFYAHEELLEKIDEFLKKKDAKLDIIIENNLEENHPFFKIKNDHSDCVNIKKIKKIGIFNHFIVADKVGYRFEEEDTNNKVIAKFNFNNPKIAEKLSIIFGLIEDRSQPFKC